MIPVQVGEACSLEMEDVAFEALDSAFDDGVKNYHHMGIESILIYSRKKPWTAHHLTIDTAPFGTRPY